MSASMIHGVSVIVCCYNAAQRLPDTLRYLALQVVSFSIPWEVIIVNNASTDNTAEVAVDQWQQLNSPAQLSVVEQSIPGLNAAREKGFREAHYEFVIMCDDDNWLDKNYIQIAHEIMCAHPSIGVLGGDIQAQCEVEPPPWFVAFQQSYAVGKQGKLSGDITNQRGFIWGAGAVVRRSAWLSVLENGFQSLLTDRKGATLSAGGDAEMCMVLRLCGWKLWYDSRLFLFHFVPASRLKWSYLRKLHYGFGASDTWKESYLFFLDSRRQSRIGSLGRFWQWRLMGDLKNLLPLLYDLLRTKSIPEGNGNVLKLETWKGRVKELLRARNAYNRSFQQMEQAAWITQSAPPGSMLKENVYGKNE
jgi:glycosyltransferase involved in cell wall biosynthesis